MSSGDDVKLFLSESEELVQKIEESILKLEENPDNRKAIQDLFFAFHTLKGLTGMGGLPNLSEFCHNFETFLQKTKENKDSLKNPSEFIEILFESLDIVLNYVEYFRLELKARGFV